MHGSPIPALDPAPLPGPPWLFHALWLLTFFIHLVFMNVVLGGSILAAVVGTRDIGRDLRTFFVETNSWAISLAVTFGIAPLLFLQVLFGRFFYSATILVAWLWFGMLVLLTIGYYLNYVAKYRLRDGRPVSLVLWLEAICFVLIAAIQVAVNLLHLEPGRWTAVAGGYFAAFLDPSFLPRFLHFVLAAVTLSAAILAFTAARRASSGKQGPLTGDLARFGVTTALYATVAQVIVGIWLLLALPGDVLRAFMAGGAPTMIPLVLAILVALGLLVVLARIRDPLATPALVRHGAELIVAAMVVMVITRHELRGFYLAPARASEVLAVKPQWDAFALFLVVFVLCVGLTVWAVVRALRDRPAAGEKRA
jgi:hypothetical protein